MVRKRKVAAYSLLEERRAYGMSQEQMAQVLMASQPSVARWERKGKLPPVRLRLLVEWMHRNKRPDQVA